MPTGTIKRLVADRGYGFIQTAEGGDVFFHRNELQGVDYDSLREGDQVEFELRRGRGGRAEATKVLIGANFASNRIDSSLNFYRERDYWYVHFPDVLVADWFGKFVSLAYQEEILQHQTIEIFYHHQLMVIIVTPFCVNGFTSDAKNRQNLCC